MTDAETKQPALGRLRRMVGQTRGVQRTIVEDQTCVDVLLQISAVQGALAQISTILMTRHIESCVRDSLRTGSERERSRKIDELVRVVAGHSGFSGRWA